MSLKPRLTEAEYQELPTRVRALYAPHEAGFFTEYYFQLPEGMTLTRAGEIFQEERGNFRKEEKARVTTNPWRKETFNLTEQGLIWKENPQLAARLKAEAVP